ncbi:MAG: rhamnogalacturonan acetylesterase [Acidobacteriota bacterium]|nr:rhamnogalacturonan acetylesterase [Acidobacteriota bacterium]
MRLPIFALGAVLFARAVCAQPPIPSLYVLGDSTAAASKQAPTIQGWGVPFPEFFDAARIRVVNAARGGRSSRTFVTEGLFGEVLAQLKPRDIVLLQFGHNDVFPINDHVARGTLHGIGEETEEIGNQVTGRRETVHTYGWYMRKMVDEVRAAGAIPVILTLTVRDRWNPDGTIERLPEAGLDLSDANRFHEPAIYSVWAVEVARRLRVPVIDVHNLIADTYQRQGPAMVSTYFHSAGDPTHRNLAGARLDAELTVSGLRAHFGTDFDRYLSAKGRDVPAAESRYILTNGKAAAGSGMMKE